MSSLSLAGLHSCPADSVELDPPTVLLYWGSSQRKHSLLPGTEQWYWWKLICWIPITISQTILRAKGQIFSPPWCPFLTVLCRCKRGSGQENENAREHEKEIQLRSFHHGHTAGGSAAGCCGESGLRTPIYLDVHELDHARLAFWENVDGIIKP